MFRSLRCSFVKFSAVAVAAALLVVPGVQAGSSDEQTAVNLATMLRSARAVISQSQKLINDASKGDKGLTGDVVVQRAKANYRKVTNADADNLDMSTLNGQLLSAMLDSIHQVMGKAQDRINEQGVGFKGFLPAIFAKAVADQFRKRKGKVADIKLTAPKNYVRNRANRPDPWESRIIEERFKAPGYPKGQHVAELTKKKGRDAYRLILPEYYKKSCLGCHGGPKGSRDITGGKREGGKEGELGGAISVTLFK